MSENAQPIISEKQKSFLTSFPNPFKEAVTISFSVTESERVRLEITGMDGRLIETLYEGMVGENEIQNIEFKSGTLPNGMYFYRMMTELGEVQNRKLLLIK